jgi:hypothetical protein
MPASKWASIARFDISTAEGEWGRSVAGLKSIAGRVELLDLNPLLKRLIRNCFSHIGPAMSATLPARIMTSA